LAIKVFADELDFTRLHTRAVPDYLWQNYRWAYVHPTAVRIFEREWLINLILWGNFGRLRDSALNELGVTINGRTLQVACVYGDFSERLAERLGPGSRLDVVDVLEIQLQNLRAKLAASAPVTLYVRDSTRLGFGGGGYDQVVIFFLLHEQPEMVRRQTLAEALRVIRPGGKLVIVDYHLPRRLHPLRYLFYPILRVLEPFALDLWYRQICEWLPRGAPVAQICKQTFCGGLYQKLVITASSAAAAKAPISYDEVGKEMDTPGATSRPRRTPAHRPRLAVGCML
jgi:ubiquinone/menaquinone biosynthesis C-methylase UbiE